MPSVFNGKLITRKHLYDNMTNVILLKSIAKLMETNMFTSFSYIITTI